MWYGRHEGGTEGHCRTNFGIDSQEGGLELSVDTRDVPFLGGVEVGAPRSFRTVLSVQTPARFCGFTPRLVCVTLGPGGPSQGGRRGVPHNTTRLTARGSRRASVLFSLTCCMCG